MNEQDQSFLGKGWSFPPVFDPELSSVVMSEGEADIRQSLIVLISTIPGERVMQPLFGCDIHGLVFRRANTETIIRLKDMIAGAILTFEPRIELNEVTTSRNREEPQRIDVIIIYTIRSTNVRTNLVYPFYLLEGTDIHDLQAQ